MFVPPRTIGTYFWKSIGLIKIQLNSGCLKSRLAFWVIGCQVSVLDLGR